METGRKLYFTNNKKLARLCRVLTSKTEEEFLSSLGDDLMEEEAVVLYSTYTKEELERNTLKIEVREEVLEEGLKQELQQDIEQGKKKIIKI